MSPDANGVHSSNVTIVNKRGLHARAAAHFVKLAKDYDAEISVRRDSQTVSGLSIMGLMMLAAAPGCEIEVLASGTEAEAAVVALCRFVESRFDED